MAGRAAAPVVILKGKLPEVPEGIETVQYERTLTSGKDKKLSAKCVLNLRVPERNWPGVLAWVKYFNDYAGEELGSEDAPVDGAVMVADALRYAIANTTAAKLNLETVEESEKFFAAFPELPTIDAKAVAASRLVAFIGEHGRPPSDKESAELYKGLVF